MTYRDQNSMTVADVVIPVYNERPEAIAATLSACLGQTEAVNKIFVVDDGSREPVAWPDWAQTSSQVCLIRLSQNEGISAARNAAIERSTAPLVACINSEVLPDPDWLSICHSYLLGKPTVGACYTRVVPQKPDQLLTRWRMRFQEPKFPEQSGPTPFAHGHAVLFRREAIDAVGGYDVRLRFHHEDSDICQRMRKLGWETHYLAQSRCVSIQRDSLKELAAKQLRDTGWYSPSDSSLIHLYVYLSKWTAVRASRNLVKGRFTFLPIDAAIWASALWMATTRTLRQNGRPPVE